MTFDLITMMEIDLIACRLAIEIDETVAPITLFTDDLLRTALKEFFADDPDWREDLLEPALAVYKETREAQDAARGLAEAFVGSFMGGYARNFGR
jgi:hypothetical protein